MVSLSRFRLLAMAAPLVASVVGCSSLAPPSFYNPGPAAYQQSRALRFDPYPEVEPAPEIVGARPLEYEKPLDEVYRSRWFLSNRSRLP